MAALPLGLLSPEIHISCRTTGLSVPGRFHSKLQRKDKRIELLQNTRNRPLAQQNAIERREGVALFINHVDDDIQTKTYPGERPHCNHDRHSKLEGFPPSLAHPNKHSNHQPSPSFWNIFDDKVKSRRLKNIKGVYAMLTSVCLAPR